MGMRVARRRLWDDTCNYLWNATTLIPCRVCLPFYAEIGVHVPYLSKCLEHSSAGHQLPIFNNDLQGSALHLPPKTPP